MPNGSIHKLGGGVAGIGINLRKQFAKQTTNPDYQIDLIETLIWGGIGCLVGCLADQLEPASHPNHRKSFHSMGFGAFIIFALHGEHSKQWSVDEAASAELFGYSYLSHLLLDLTTKKGLPFL